MPTVSERKQAARTRRRAVDPAEPLKALEGPWVATGSVYASEYGAASSWSSREQGEWLWGKRFLLHHWRAQLGAQPFEGLTVFGFSEARGYFATLYDNAGNSATYEVEIAGPVWTLSGERQRSTWRFSPDGRSIDIHWDWRARDGSWKPLCDRRAVRVQLGV